MAHLLFRNLGEALGCALLSRRKEEAEKKGTEGRVVDPGLTAVFCKSIVLLHYHESTPISAQYVILS